MGARRGTRRGSLISTESISRQRTVHAGTAVLQAARVIRLFIGATTRQSRAGNIALAVIFSLAALITAAALILRTQGSYLGSFFSAESRESREAAEYGMRTIISELSRTPNRRLLVANKSQGAWINPSQWGNASFSSALANPCALTTVNNNITAAKPPALAGLAGATPAGTANLEGQVNSGKRYWLRSITYRNSSSSGTRSEISFTRTSSTANWIQTPSTGVTYNPDAVSLEGATTAYLELQVQGESTQAGKTSVAVVTKEFELVPKCCGRSFGYTYASLSNPVASFGQDLRSCPSVGLGVLNFVTGGNGDGVFSTNGKSFDLWENQIGTNQDTAITFNPNDTKALDSNTNLVLFGQTLPSQLSPPASTVFPNSACIGQNVNVTLPRDGLLAPDSDGTPNQGLVDSACQGSSTTSTRTDDVYQQNGNAKRTGKNPDFVYSCDAPEYSVSPNTAATENPPRAIPSGAILVDNRLNIIAGSPNYTKCYVKTTKTTTVNLPEPYCLQQADTNEWWCKVRHINSGGLISIDTTGGKTVTLLFTDVRSTDRATGLESNCTSGVQCILGGSSSFAGIGGFNHQSDLGNPAPLADSSRFRIVNSVLGSDFELKGATGALSGFFDLRYSDVLMYGGGANSNINLSGILWTNNLALNGNATFVNPPSGNCTDPNPAAGSTCALLRALYPNLFDDDPTNDDTRPLFDLTPRSIFTLRMFGL